MPWKDKQKEKEWRHKKYLQNKAQVLEKNRQWVKANPEKYKAQQDRYRKKHPDRVKTIQKNWNDRNIDLIEGYKKKHKAKVLSTPSIRIQRLYTHRIKSALKSRGIPMLATPQILLGCSWSEFVDYLTSLLKPEWSWENYTTLWQVDHINEICTFDLLTLESQKKCFHFTNTQPLPPSENKRKHTRIRVPLLGYKNAFQKQEVLSVAPAPESLVFPEPATFTPFTDTNPEEKF